MTDYTPEQMNDMFKRVFEQHAEGVIVLEHLILKFAKGAVTVGGIDGVLRTYLQAGHREVLDYILLRINRANGVQDQPEEE